MHSIEWVAVDVHREVIAVAGDYFVSKETPELQVIRKLRFDSCEE